MSEEEDARIGPTLQLSDVACSLGTVPHHTHMDSFCPVLNSLIAFWCANGLHRGIFHLHAGFVVIILFTNLVFQYLMFFLFFLIVFFSLPVMGFLFFFLWVPIIVGFCQRVYLYLFVLPKVITKSHYKRSLQKVIPQKVIPIPEKCQRKQI
jgi:hypothetical protein